MLDIAASARVLTALLAWVNRRRLKLPATIGVMATSLLLSLALVALAARWLTVGLPVALARRASRLPAGAGSLLTWGGLRG